MSEPHRAGPHGRASALAAALMAALAISGAAQAAEACLRFEAPEDGGVVVVALFDSEAAWARRSHPVRTATPAVAHGAAQVRLAGLPQGAYAVMAYQDRNRDNKLNTLPIGLPTEPYGFSNNARGRFGPPSWDSAAFRIGPDCAMQTIKLR